jgi:hypothetical protein
MQRHLTFLRPAAVLVTALVASVAIAACGGSSSAGSSAAGSSASANTGLKFASCVRAHGVPDYPDPHGGKVTVDIHKLSESARAVEAALGKCAKFEPGPDLSSLPRLTASQMAQVRVGGLDYAKCMRAKGLTNFPDPTITPGPGGHGIAMGYSLKELKQDHSVFHSAAYETDNKACGPALDDHFPAVLKAAAGTGTQTQGG